MAERLVFYPVSPTPKPAARRFSVVKRFHQTVSPNVGTISGRLVGLRRERAYASWAREMGCMRERKQETNPQQPSLSEGCWGFPYYQKVIPLCHAWRIRAGKARQSPEQHPSRRTIRHQPFVQKARAWHLGAPRCL